MAKADIKAGLYVANIYCCCPKCTVSMDHSVTPEWPAFLITERQPQVRLGVVVLTQLIHPPTMPTTRKALPGGTACKSVE